MTNAHSLQCVANLRMIGSGLGLYLHEYGYYPGALTGVSSAPIWYRALHPYIQGARTVNWDGRFPDYYLCPSRQPVLDGEDGLGYGYNYLGYGHKPESSGEWGNPSNSYMGKYWHVRLNQVINMESIVIGDNREYGNGGYPMFIYNSTGEPSHAHSERHNGGGHYLFADGRVEWRHAVELRERLRERGRDGATKWIFRPF